VLEAIERLQELQRLDSALAERQKISADYPADLAILEEEYNREKAGIEGKRTELMELQKRRRHQEGALSDGEEHLKKSQVRLNQVKTNKEYEATLKEIEALRQKNSGLEGEILLLYDEVEAAEKRLKESERVWKDFEVELSEKKRTLAEVKARAEVEAAELLGRREQLAAGLGPELAHYDRLRKALGDPVVVPAENEGCTACDCKVPAQLYNQILKNEQIIHCPHCSRYLVHAPVARNVAPVMDDDD
jgi:uncharacterized protein